MNGRSAAIMDASRLAVSLAGFGIWAFLMYQAYQQKLFKLPIVGKFAARHAGVKL